MKKKPLPDLVAEKGQAAVAKALGVSPAAISKALNAEREIVVTVNRDAELLAQILESLAKHCTCQGWLKDDGQFKLNAALVIGWSFDAEFSEAALLEFLRESPYIATEVDRFASDRRRFFGKSSTGSPKD